MLLREGFDLYKRDCIVFQNQSPKTEENHEVAKRSLLAYVGELEASGLTFEHIRKWKLHLEKDKSPVTVRNYITKVRVVIAFLYKRHLIDLDPETIPLPKRTDKVPAFLTKEQVAILIDCTSRVKNKAIISLLYASGIRVSELCSLDRNSIHEDSFTIIGKGGRARLCFIDERSTGLLQIYLDSRIDNNQALFLTDHGSRITPGTVQETFKSVRKRSGIKACPHTMRHSFATNLLKTNTNLFYVQRFLGHKSLQTTQQYLHVYDGDLKQIYTKHHTI